MTAYEWLTGEQPFKGSFAEICSQHLFTPPTPLRQKVPSLSPAVEQAILIALSKDPQRRFSSVQAFANALAQASGVNQGFSTPMGTNSTIATRNEEQISTLVKPSSPTPPLQPVGNLQNNSSPSNPPQQQFNSSPPQQFTTPPPQSWSFPIQPGMTPGQFPPQGPPTQQENRRRGNKSNKGRLVAIIALVVILIAVASAGGIYVFASRKTPFTGGVGPTQPVATSPVASGTIPENLLLTCGTNCNDPIRVTITTIQVNDADGNMIWNVSLEDITGTNVGYGVGTFELLANGSQTQIPATVSQSSGSLTNNVPYTIQATFAFVPIQNTTYTLTVLTFRLISLLACRLETLK